MKIVTKQTYYGPLTKKRDFWFTLVAKNGKTLMTSEMYKTPQARDKAVKAINDWYDGGKNFLKIIKELDLKKSRKKN